MRDIQLKEWEWVAQIQYENFPDSEFHISSLNNPDFLSAAALVQEHIKECWPYEIISLRQKIIK